jgi:hypothetical protein
VRLMDIGKSIFDSPNRQVKTDLMQWEPILNWLSSGSNRNEVKYPYYSDT